VDVVILNSRREPTVLRNRSAANHWLQVQLHGVAANRDALGARVRVVAGGRAQIAEVQAGRGYQSSYGTRLYFGLADADRIDRIEIQWPGRGRDVLTDVPVNRKVTVVEGGLVPSR
jgi:hypothetical protein